MRAATGASLIAFLSSVTFCQSTPAPPAFEAASVKPNKSGSPQGGLQPRPDGLTGTNVTLKQLVLEAYSLHAAQVSGPSWIETEGYDVTARAKEAAGRTQIQLMLQALPSDRFKLKCHRGTKDMPVYLLVVARGGPKLRDAKEGENAFNALTKDGASPFKPGLASIFKPADLPAFAERLGRPLDHPVLDKSGIKGRYWFQLEWVPDPGPGTINVGPSLLNALKDQLGLALETQKAPLEILVIDKAEKPSGS
jgi:uncharacterized protein (TIGR03435 family)